ncbi:unnamed protein product [Rhizophagus irregularis]|uniref:Uncharacterized protein n=1 Tax=Rhizophagus irregularis TaxID=588596 RepID=A0A915ZQA1_9GLOM|nr:unnamed protein product [Rhizophagus irregularis]CAB5386672.1 unnamed protein product [Rhizophagus irregularis]
MAATMSVFCLIETKFNDSKSGAEFEDAVFKIGQQSYEKFKWKVFYNTYKGSHSNSINPLTKMTLYIQYVWKIYIYQKFELLFPNLNKQDISLIPLILNNDI